MTALNHDLVRSPVLNTSSRLSYRQQRHNSFIAALPFVTCLTLPLTQVANLFYVYDLVTAGTVCFLLMTKPGVTARVSLPIGLPLFVIASFASGTAGLFWSGVDIRPLQMLVQNILAVAYAGTIYWGLRTQRINFSDYARPLVLAGLLQAAFMILQGVGFRVAPDLTAQVYRAYLDFSGFSTRFLDLRFLAEISNTGVSRVMGTWDVATTASGMVALSVLPLLLLNWRLHVKLIIFGVVAWGLLETGTRHAWVLAALVLVGILYMHLPKRLFLALSALVCGVLIGFLGVSTPPHPTSDSVGSTVEQRLQRTFEQGLADSSIQLRYVDGTQRFLSGIAKNPQIAIFGFGSGTEKALYEKLGPYAYDEAAAENFYWGFVSNGWLLSVRNFGVIGFVALIALCLPLFTAQYKTARFIGVFMVLLIAADNYSIEVQRCIMLIFAIIASVLGAHDAWRGRGTPLRNP